MKPNVYLAGPIMGCDFGEANDWRHHVAAALIPHKITGISPLRCEPIHGAKYTAEYPDPRFGTPRAISGKNRFDVLNGDITLALLPKPIGKPQSYGTIVEIAWANMAGKQVILCSDDPFVAKHPVLDSCVNWKFVTRDCDPTAPEHFRTIQDCVEAAIETIIGVLGGYAGGKNV
jgi:nucleoside 2-deoxyribosyltransferase